jgi:rhomboid protease GluP
MGAMIYALVRHRGKIQDLSMKQLLIMAAFSLYFGFTSSGVDNAAHVGGMVSGFLFAVILYHPRKIRKTEP